MKNRFHMMRLYPQGGILDQKFCKLKNLTTLIIVRIFIQAYLNKSIIFSFFYGSLPHKSIRCLPPMSISLYKVQNRFMPNHVYIFVMPRYDLRSFAVLWTLPNKKTKCCSLLIAFDFWLNVFDTVPFFTFIFLFS